MVGRKTSKPRPSSCPLTNCSQWLWVQRAYQRRIPLSIISEIRSSLPLTRSDKAPPASVWPWFPIPNLHCLSSRSRRSLFAETRRLRFSEQASGPLAPPVCIPVLDHRNEYLRSGLSVMSLKLLGRIPEGVSVVLWRRGQGAY